MTEEIDFNIVSDFFIFILISVFWKQFRNKESPVPMFFVKVTILARGVMQLEWLFYQ